MAGPLRSVARRAFKLLESVFPSAYYVLRYKQSQRRVQRTYETRDKDLLWKKFFEEANAPGKQCLQIGVREEVLQKYGPNWVSVDKFDEREFIDHHDDIHDLHFADNTFDAVACIAILEHLPMPSVAVAQLHRVLKPGGVIWISLPMSYPYHEAPKDYWRATPDGLRVWMAEFEEISCGVNYWTRSPLVCSTHFYGRKRAAA